MKKIAAFICLWVIIGCASWKSIPQVAKNSNPYFDVSMCSESFWTFNLKVKNKTDKNIEIDWNRTYFIDVLGNTNGRFTFGEENYWEDRNMVPPPTIIFPNTVMEKNLYPVANRYWKRSWQWSYMDLGKNGILLTALVDGKIIEERMYLKFIVDTKSENKNEK